MVVQCTHCGRILPRALLVENRDYPRYHLMLCHPSKSMTGERAIDAVVDQLRAMGTGGGRMEDIIVPGMAANDVARALADQISYGYVVQATNEENQKHYHLVVDSFHHNGEPGTPSSITSEDEGRMADDERSRYDPDFPIHLEEIADPHLPLDEDSNVYPALKKTSVVDLDREFASCADRQETMHLGMCPSCGRSITFTTGIIAFAEHATEINLSGGTDFALAQPHMVKAMNQPRYERANCASEITRVGNLGVDFTQQCVSCKTSYCVIMRAYPTPLEHLKGDEYTEEAMRMLADDEYYVRQAASHQDDLYRRQMALGYDPFVVDFSSYASVLDSLQVRQEGKRELTKAEARDCYCADSTYGRALLTKQRLVPRSSKEDWIDCLHRATANCAYVIPPLVSDLMEQVQESIPSSCGAATSPAVRMIVSQEHEAAAQEDDKDDEKMNTSSYSG